MEAGSEAMGLVTLVSLLLQKMEISVIKRVKKILQRHFMCLSPSWSGRGMAWSPPPQTGQALRMERALGKHRPGSSPHPTASGPWNLGRVALHVRASVSPSVQWGWTLTSHTAVCHALSTALAGLPVGPRVPAPRPCDSSSSHLLGAKPAGHAVPEVDVTI